MDIIITQWALDSYLDLKAQRVFTDSDYRQQLRPDILLLQDYPNNIKFRRPKFWSVAQDSPGRIIADGYKMKWHQVGQGKVQMRLPVSMRNAAYLCEAYVKHNTKQELRQLARFKTYLQIIRQNKHTECGRLS